MEDVRLGSLIKPFSQEALDESTVAILGIPTDEGIARNGGRVGASAAPKEIRHWLHKLTPYAGPNFKEQLDSLSMVDMGDVATADLETMHEEARTRTAELIAQGKIVIALGGGHDVAYPCLLYTSPSPRD